MPVFDIECLYGSCGVTEDEFLFLSEIKDGFKCPQCGGGGRHLIGFVSREEPPPARLGAHGPTETNPLIIHSAGLAFTSQSQIRAWEKANPDNRLVAKTDRKGFGEHYDRVRNRVEATARRQGFKSHRDRGVYLKAKQARERTTGKIDPS